MYSRVYNADCLEAMRQMPANAFNLAIVDPPYGIGEDGSRNRSRGKLAKPTIYKAYTGNDKEPPSVEYFHELMRISKNQIIWGANHFISRMPYNSSCWIVWDKENGESDFADCELAWSSFDSSVRKFKYKWQGMLQENMKDKEVRIHPNQKPIALYKWILSNYAKPGDKILDTHLGSGSSRIACDQLGFDFTGYELDTHYYNIQERRYKEYKAQLVLKF